MLKDTHPSGTELYTRGPQLPTLTQGYEKVPTVNLGTYESRCLMILLSLIFKLNLLASGFLGVLRRRI